MTLKLSGSEWRYYENLSDKSEGVIVVADHKYYVRESIEFAIRLNTNKYLWDRADFPYAQQIQTMDEYNNGVLRTSDWIETTFNEKE